MAEQRLIRHTPIVAAAAWEQIRKTWSQRSYPEMVTRTEVHQAIDRLDDNQLGRVMAVVQDLLEQDPDPVWQRLRTISGVKLPAHWPPRFQPIEPLKVEGEMPSERLIRERR